MTHKGKSKIGRPAVPKAKARSIYISTRISPEEHDAIKKAIRESGKTKSNWLRDVLLEKATSVIGATLETMAR